MRTATCVLIAAVSLLMWPVNSRSAVSAWDEWQGYEDLKIRVWTSKGEGAVYEEATPIKIHFQVTEPAFVAVYEIDTEGNANLLFPVHPGQDNFCEPERTYNIPGRGSYELLAVGPPGIAYIHAIASSAPLRLPVSPEVEQGGYIQFDSIEGDPTAGMGRIAESLVGVELDDAYVASDIVHYYVGHEVTHARYVCADCHSGSTYHPYRDTCSRFQVVVVADWWTHLRFCWPFYWHPRYYCPPVWSVCWWWDCDPYYCSWDVGYYRRCYQTRGSDPWRHHWYGYAVESRDYRKTKEFVRERTRPGRTSTYDGDGVKYVDTSGKVYRDRSTRGAHTPRSPAYAKTAAKSVSERGYRERPSASYSREGGEKKSGSREQVTKDRRSTRSSPGTSSKPQRTEVKRSTSKQKSSRPSSSSKSSGSRSPRTSSSSGRSSSSGDKAKKR